MSSGEICADPFGLGRTDRVLDLMNEISVGCHLGLAGVNSYRSALAAFRRRR
jgi:hypothetical protein